MVKLDVIDQKGGSVEKIDFSKDFLDVPYNERFGSSDCYICYVLCSPGL